MKRTYFAVLALWVATYAVASHAQADACDGALDALNRVKERINPSLNPSTDLGRKRLEVMLHTLENGTRVCTDPPMELWAYREMVGRRLGTPLGLQSAKYAKSKLEEASFDLKFDPFTPPPAAVTPTVQEQAQPIAKKWALVIGINTFTDPHIHSLNFASKDASDFAHFLADPRGGRFPATNVELLSNEAATLGNINEGLGTLHAKAGPNDLVVIYISSHGSPRDLDPGGMSYIITHDTSIESPARLYATSLQMVNLVQQINRDIRARRVVLILDTCYSGDAQRSVSEAGDGSKGITRVWSDPPPPAQAASAAGFSQALENLTFGYGRAVITASRADQRSWESRKLQNGYFTHYLLAALQSNEGATLETVFNSVQSQVAANVHNEEHAEQTPTSQFSDQAKSIVLTTAGMGTP